MAGYELRMHTPLRAGFHDKGEPCPEVFRGANDSWIACSHPDHAKVESEEMRRRRLQVEVIPARIAAENAKQTESHDTKVVMTNTENNDPTTEAPAAAPPDKAVSAKRSRTPRECTCGCGEMTKGGKFRPGHDARLHSSLVATVSDIEARLETRQAALARLESLNWGHHVPDAVREGLKDGFA